MRSVKLIRTAKAAYIALSALFCAMGIALMARPDITASWISVAVGVALIAFGAVKLAGYFSRDLYRLAFQFDLAFGLLLVLIGSVMLMKPDLALSGVCVVMGIEAIADGLFKLQTAVDTRRFGLDRWWLILAMAVVAAAAGIALVLHPAKGVRILMTLLGATLLADGALNLCVGLCAVKIVANQRPDGAAPGLY